MMHPAFRIFPIAVVMLLTACASTGPAENHETVFYPKLPERPRIQFLTTISSDVDLRRISGVGGGLLGAREKRALDRPVAVGHEKDRLYVVDRAHKKVIIIDLETGKFEPFPDKRLGTLKEPTDIAVTEDGYKFVADPDRGQVVVFDAMNEYVRTYGKMEQYAVTGVAVRGDRVYLVDNRRNQIVVLDRDSGDVLLTIGSGDPEALSWAPGEFHRPYRIAVDHEGRIFVADTLNFRVQVFDADGNFIRMYGENYIGPGGMPRSKGIAVDREGRFYLADAMMELVQIFDIRLEYPLLAFGKARADVGSTELTHGVHIDYDNVERFAAYADPDFKPIYLIYVTSFTGLNKLNVYAYGEWIGPDL